MNIAFCKRKAKTPSEILPSNPHGKPGSRDRLWEANATQSCQEFLFSLMPYAGRPLTLTQRDHAEWNLKLLLPETCAFDDNGSSHPEMIMFLDTSHENVSTSYKNVQKKKKLMGKTE